MSLSDKEIAPRSRRETEEVRVGLDSTLQGGVRSAYRAGRSPEVEQQCWLPSIERVELLIVLSDFYIFARLWRVRDVCESCAGGPGFLWAAHVSLYNSGDSAVISRRARGSSSSLC